MRHAYTVMRHTTLKAKASILGVSLRRVLNKRQREHKNKRQRERYNVAAHARRGNEIERARRARAKARHGSRAFHADVRARGPDMFFNQRSSRAITLRRHQRTKLLTKLICE